MSLHLFAGLRVRDFQAARRWYERLLGEPAFFPHASEAVWTLAENRSIYVVAHADGAGSSVVALCGPSPPSCPPFAGPPIVYEQGPHLLELVVGTAGFAVSVSDGLVIRR